MLILHTRGLISEPDYYILLVVVIRSSKPLEIMNISNKAALTSQNLHTQRRVCLSSAGCIDVHSKAAILIYTLKGWGPIRSVCARLQQTTKKYLLQTINFNKNSAALYPFLANIRDHSTGFKIPFVSGRYGYKVLGSTESSKT
jgi:hypothetical protein